MYVMGIIATILLALAALTLLRLRFRFEIAGDIRRIFVGLGRSGLELDFVARKQILRLFGWRINESPFEETKDPLEQEAIRSAETLNEPGEQTASAKPEKTRKSRRERPWRDVLRVIPGCSRALWSYSIGLLRSLIVEELEAEIEAGFDSPDLTGTAFGCYQAALAAAPGVVGRIRFTPDWQGGSFDGQARGSVALPLYRLLLRTMLLLWQLPLRDLIKLAIGKQRGGQDG